MKEWKIVEWIRIGTSRSLVHQRVYWNN